MARSRSFTLLGRTLTIRFPYTWPSPIIAAVLSMFSTSFVAVPAFMRVDPVIISGPVSGSMGNSTARDSSESGVQLIPMVTAPSLRASPTAPSTYGVRPLAAIPTRASPELKPHSSRSRAPIWGSSSLASLECARAYSPPAMIPCTSSGGTP